MYEDYKQKTAQCVQVESIFMIVSFGLSCVLAVLSVFLNICFYYRITRLLGVCVVLFFMNLHS